MIRARAFLVSLVTAGLLLLSACSADPAQQWRDDVRAAATQAQSGDYAGADATLAALADEVGAARDQGHLPADRADGILTSIDALRAELSGLLSPDPAPDPIPSDPSPPAPVEPTDSGDRDEKDSDEGKDDPDGGGGKGNGDSGSENGKSDGGKSGDDNPGKEKKEKSE